MNMSAVNIKKYIEEVAPEFGITRASLFGSYATDSKTEESDIDLLVEFAEPAVSLFTQFDLKFKLEELTGKSIDLVHGPLGKDSLIHIDKEVLLYEKPRRANPGKNPGRNKPDAVRHGGDVA